MTNTGIQKEDVSSGADVVPEEAPTAPGKSQNSDVPVPIPKNSDVDGQANGSGENGSKSGNLKRLKVLLASPEKEDENAKKRKTWLLSDSEAQESDDAGTPEEQEMFRREVETLYKENSFEFKTPKFYGKPLNMLKLWRTVVKRGGYGVVSNSKLWRQVGETFNPPKTCTTVSFTFRNFYEKGLLEYENHLKEIGELDLPKVAPVMLTPKVEEDEVMLPPRNAAEASGPQGSRLGRVQRTSALHARLSWHDLDLIGPEENEKDLVPTPKSKKLKTIGVNKNKPPTSRDIPDTREGIKQSKAEIYDVGPVADWVKISVYETKDSYEVYALVPGLLREEVRVQSEPSGRILITGKPDELDSPWGITPFQKVVALSSRIDAPRTSAVLTLYGKLFIRVPFKM